MERREAAKGRGESRVGAAASSGVSAGIARIHIEGGRGATCSGEGSQEPAARTRRADGTRRASTNAPSASLGVGGRTATALRSDLSRAADPGENAASLGVNATMPCGKKLMATRKSVAPTGEHVGEQSTRALYSTCATKMSVCAVESGRLRADSCA